MSLGTCESGHLGNWKSGLIAGRPLRYDYSIMKLRVGLVGLGKAWEVRHRAALRALSDRFEVRAVCEEVGHRARQAAEEFDAAHVDGYRALVRRDDVDAMLMLSPQWYGSLPILAACEYGKAIYCAAALDLEPDQALKIRDRVRASGVAFMAEFPRRQAPATLRLKELMATSLGPPTLLFGHQRLIVDTEPADGSVRPVWHASPMMRSLMELVDWCRYVVDAEPTSVVGVSHCHRSSQQYDEDYLMMSLDFSAVQAPSLAATAQISCGHYMPSAWKEAVSFRPPAGLQVCCENGVAFVDFPSRLTWFDSAGRHEESLDTERPVGELLLSHFHRAVTSLVRKTSDLEDAYQAIRIVLAAQQSCQEGQRITLDC